ncbi:MAG: serine hydrolase [Candidatus Azambacteria bacterium]|nr:serine hydrolase [Candidatus Azambacteria bacterium]
MDENKKFYLKFSLIIAAIFFIWISGNEKIAAPEAAVKKLPANNKPAALVNFTPEITNIFDDSKNTLPRRDWSVPYLELQAQAALAIKTDGSRVYYNKNIETQRSIASLTKLMTAIIVTENYDLDTVVEISRNAVKREGSNGDLRPSESITIRSLLDIMLIESSNDAAFALSQQRPDFISLMNKKAEELGLSQTHFINPDGLDSPNSHSSALDIAKIFGYLINRYPETFEILKTKNMVVYSFDGKIEHRLANTNELLGKVDGIVAGKTGYTDNAGGSLILLTKDDIITVVLGSPARFEESEKLINWLKTAYIWEK